MPERTGYRYESDRKLHLRYVRLPDKVLDEYDESLYRSGSVIVGRSQIVSEHSVVFDHEVVLAKGFQIIYFELMRKWFSVGKIRDFAGRYTGYYCDIVKPPRLLEDGGLEVTDLFLDLWVSPDMKYKVLDEEELEDAFNHGWITRQLYERAKEELKLIDKVQGNRFPPPCVRYLEKKLHI
jgi:predicted RNA-binding protein associated with RNAse of E/G family